MRSKTTLRTVKTAAKPVGQKVSNRQSAFAGRLRMRLGFWQIDPTRRGVILSVAAAREGRMRPNERRDTANRTSAIAA
jgi:hypothetical protein